MPGAPVSPHYSTNENRTSWVSGSDADIRAALDALRHVAALDPDRAHALNGVGFSQSDSRLGHRLARLSPAAVSANPFLCSAVLQLAARYRRQVPAGIRYAAGLTDQADLFG